MSEAPERIWVKTRGVPKYYEFPCEDLPLLVEYVRADRIEELEAKLAKAVEAIFEAIYLLAPDEEDIAKGTGLYRIVTTFKELKGQDDAVLHGD